MTQLSVTRPCVKSNDPRKEGQCLLCSQYGSGLPCPDPPARNDLTETRPRDRDLEKHFMDIAARAAGCFKADETGEDYGLSEYADKRALPGGVRANMDHRREACEEAADLRNYLVWRAEAVYDDAMAGDAVALDRYEWAMRCLSKTIPLWRELLRDAS
jgi:hypothetical protein